MTSPPVLPSKKILYPCQNNQVPCQNPIGICTIYHRYLHYIPMEIATNRSLKVAIHNCQQLHFPLKKVCFPRKMHIFTQTTDILIRKIASISENNITFVFYKYKQETSNKSLLSFKKNETGRKTNKRRKFSAI